MSESNEVVKLLFIGNSATYVHDIPGTLESLAKNAGYRIECESIVEGGAKLSFHADDSSEHGKALLRMLNNKYDIVFLQDNGNCISSEDLRLESQKACDVLGRAIRSAGARVGIYFRPPYGYEKWGYTPFEQCRETDRHFLKASISNDALNVYVNRAFAYAMKNTDYCLWGSDNAHTSEYGAYLAVCIFFATIFSTSSKVLDSNGLPEKDAKTLQKIADKIALREEIPW